MPRLPHGLSTLESTFLLLWTSEKGPKLTGEYRFHPERRWRIDFCLPEKKIGIELEGLWGRHQNIGGFLKDIEKYAEATLLGWTIIRLTIKQMDRQWINRVIKFCNEA